MRVLLDDSLCNVEAVSVAEAIAGASAVAERQGRIIVEVRVDGVPWICEGETDSLQVPDQVQEIHLISADPIELVGETFRDAAVALNDAERLQAHTAKLLQAGDLTTAMARLDEVIGIWSAVQQALTLGVEVAQINLECIAPAGHGEAESAASVGDVLAELNTHLREIQNALTNGDTAALADTLLYEMPPVMRQWRLMLHDLQSHLGGRGKDS
jgi:hypothetical protein